MGRGHAVPRHAAQTGGDTRSFAARRGPGLRIRAGTVRCAASSGLRAPGPAKLAPMTLGPETSYRVRGGAPLHGTVFVQGAKNAALKMIAASLLTGNGHTVLRNVPPIEDVRRAVELAEAVGAVVEFHETERTLVVDASNLTSPVLPAEIARRFRSSVLFVPALLHRFGEAVIEGVGGCKPGNKEPDLHHPGLAPPRGGVGPGDPVIPVQGGQPQGVPP